jgi:hypothetical protein
MDRKFRVLGLEIPRYRTRQREGRDALLRKKIGQPQPDRAGLRQRGRRAGHLVPTCQHRSMEERSAPAARGAEAPLRPLGPMHAHHGRIGAPLLPRTGAPADEQEDGAATKTTEKRTKTKPLNPKLRTGN